MGGSVRSLGERRGTPPPALTAPMPMQGNRVNRLRGEQAGEEVVIPAGGLALEAQ